MRNDYKDVDPAIMSILIVLRLLDKTDTDSETLSSIPVSILNPLFKWVLEEQIKEKVMTVEKWLELGFHLCKQRWDNSMEWLEDQPISKIMCMLQILNDFNIKQNEEIKNAGKRK